jgi:hypothetical protein
LETVTDFEEYEFPFSLFFEDMTGGEGIPEEMLEN